MIYQNFIASILLPIVFFAGANWIYHKCRSRDYQKIHSLLDRADFRNFMAQNGIAPREEELLHAYHRYKNHREPLRVANQEE